MNIIMNGKMVREGSDLAMRCYFVNFAEESALREGRRAAMPVKDRERIKKKNKEPREKICH